MDLRNMNIWERINKINLFLPVSKELIFWYLFVIAYMFTAFVMTILVNCFSHDYTKTILFEVVNNLMPVVLSLDILISLNTGFIKNGKIILNREAANIEYISTVYFYCDMIALVTSIMQISFQNTISAQGVTLFNYMVFIKLTTAYYIDSLFRKYVIKSFTIAIYYQVVKNFLILALLCHVIGSFYFYIDVLMFQNTWYPVDQLWIFNSYAFADIYYQDFWVQYSYSYYVACVTLSGTAYGDIIPLNPYENLYIFCCFVFPMLIYSYVYSSIFTALFNRRSTSAQIRRYKFLAKDYLNSLGITYKVMNKILTYLQFTYKKNMIVDTKFIDDLAPTIKNKYLHKILEGKFRYECFQYILKISNLDQHYLKQNIFQLVEQEYFPERFSLLTSQKLKIYYINSGKVVEVVKLKEQKKLCKPIHKHNHVGKTAFFTNQIPTKKLRYESNSFVISHSIQYKRFRKVSKQKMPTLNEAFCLLQSKILDQKQYQIMNQKCYFCDQISHILQNCPHLNPDRQSFFSQRQHFKQERKSFNRDYMIKRPKLLKKNSAFIKLYSSQQTVTNKNRKSKRIYVTRSKKIENNLLNLFLDHEFYQYLAEFNIKQKNYIQQTSQQDIQSERYDPINQRTKPLPMEKVCIWDKYYPNYNITG